MSLWFTTSLVISKGQADSSRRHPRNGTYDEERTTISGRDRRTVFNVREFSTSWPWVREITTGEAVASLRFSNMRRSTPQLPPPYGAYFVPTPVAKGPLVFSHVTSLASGTDEITFAVLIGEFLLPMEPSKDGCPAGVAQNDGLAAIRDVCRSGC